MAKRGKKEDASALLARGQALVDANNAEAEAVLMRALGLATTPALRGACEDTLGLLRRRNNDSDGAMTFFRKAIDSYREGRHADGEARTLVHLAGVEIDTGLREEAIADLRTAFEVAKKTGDDKLEAHVADVLSYALDAAGEKEEAEKLAKHGFDLLSKTGDKRQLGISLGNQAVQHQLACRFAEAEAGYRRALELSESAGDLHNAAIVAVNLSTLFVSRGRFTDAKPFIEKGMAMHEKIGNRAGAAHAALSMADILSAEGDSLGTIELQRKAIAVFHASGNRWLEGVALGNMANEEMTLHRLEQALEHHTQSIELLEKARQPHSVGSTLTNRALVLAEMGRIDDGLNDAKRALGIFEGSDERWEGIAFLSLGMIQHLSTIIEAARQSYERGLELLEKAGDPSQTARALIGLAAIDIQRGFDDSAKEKLERAKELGKKAGERESAILADALLAKSKEPPRGIIARLLWRVLKF